MDNDTKSIFTYDDEDGAIPDSFSLTALTSVANRLFSPKTCVLEKLAEGGYHKVYNVKTSDGEELGVVARVASPVFPKDKLESEVATMKYIAEMTSVPVPRVIAWNSDSSNEVGAEYMFISKIHGVSAQTAWLELSIDSKKNMVRQVAECLFKLWELRFDAMGCLYLANKGKDYSVGPIIDTRFHRTIDGVPRTKEPIDLNEFRGPFSSISSYLASGIQAELKLYSERREDLIAEGEGVEEWVESGRKAMEKALELCEIYPGDRPISNEVKEPITLRLDDFRLSNIMINPETGDLNAFIDFESATTAPGWLCADVPVWLRDVDSSVDSTAHSTLNDEGDDDDDVFEDLGESNEDFDSQEVEEQKMLLEEFLQTMEGLDRDGSWFTAYETGRPYREFAESLSFFIGVWGRFNRGLWVESTLRWLREHPGVSVPSDVESLYPELLSGWQPTQGMDRGSES